MPIVSMIKIVFTQFSATNPIANLSAGRLPGTAAGAAIETDEKP